MNIHLHCLAAALAALLLAAPAAPAQQANPDSADPLVERLEILESEYLHLKNEVNVLRERLDALLGESPQHRIYDFPVDGSQVRGNAEAPVTLLEFGDFQSEYAARAAHVVQRLLEEYPSNLRFVFKHYPLTSLHPQATEAALAALAAEKQERGWEMHDLLFRNSRRLDANVYLVLAQDLGMDLSRFDQDRRSLWALERLAADEKQAVRTEVSGVPTFFLNGLRMRSWRYGFLKEQIEALLAEPRNEDES